MLALRLPAEVENRLRELAAKSGHSTEEYLRRIILDYVEDIEDAELAMERLKAGGKRISLEELERQFAAEADA